MSGLVVPSPDRIDPGPPGVKVVVVEGHLADVARHGNGQAAGRIGLAEERAHERGARLHPGNHAMRIAGTWLDAHSMVSGRPLKTTRTTGFPAPDHGFQEPLLVARQIDMGPGRGLAGAAAVFAEGHDDDIQLFRRLDRIGKSGVRGAARPPSPRHSPARGPKRLRAFREGPAQGRHILGPGPGRTRSPACRPRCRPRV